MSYRKTLRKSRSATFLSVNECFQFIHMLGFFVPTTSYRFPQYLLRRLLFSVFANVVKMTDLLKLYLVHEMFRKLQQTNDNRQCQLLKFPDVLFYVLSLNCLISTKMKLKISDNEHGTMQRQNLNNNQKKKNYEKKNNKTHTQKNRQTHFRSRHFRKPVQSSHQPIIFKKHWFEKEHDKDARACLFANKTAN